MFSFPPMSENEALGLFPKGEYQYTVSECVAKISKKGNNGLEAKLKVYGSNGEVRTVVDFLMYDFMGYKLRHFLITLLGEEKYKSGNIDPKDLIGKSGIVKLYIQESEGYQPKNAVTDYLAIDSVGSMKDAIQGAIDQNFNDVVPF